MIDLHCTTGTPGAVAAVLALAAIPVGDLAVVAGVPMRPDARLIMWGSSSLIANTIARNQLISQDCVDPLHGEDVNLGATSLQNLDYHFTNIPYKTGGRAINQGTNTAQTATSLGMTLDYYEGGPMLGAAGMRFHENKICLPQVCIADVAVAWTTTPFAPAIAIPNGKYALLGVVGTILTEGHFLRFIHADFGGFMPGFPALGQSNSAILGLQKGPKDVLQCSPGMQFVVLSELTGKPCVPTFTVSNAGTGLLIQSISGAATDTPNVSLCLAKVG
ncbi:hypothetical protein MUP79_01455 [Candidatus Bathyarchaeota archaeon]|nr:hypothetical protein [Candidatus Bathyarchaeota archaeon]